MCDCSVLSLYPDDLINSQVPKDCATDCDCIRVQDGETDLIIVHGERCFEVDARVLGSEQRMQSGLHSLNSQVGRS